MSVDENLNEAKKWTVPADVQILACFQKLKPGSAPHTIHGSTMNELLFLCGGGERAKKYYVDKEIYLRRYYSISKKRRGRPREPIFERIVMILAEEYDVYTGNRPTITTHPYKSGHPVSGKFVELVRDIFKIFGIAASVPATSRKLRDIYTLRRSAQDQAEARLKERGLIKSSNSD